MNTSDSFKATIWYGTLYIVLVYASAVIHHATYAAWLIVATAGLAYLAQALNTMGNHVQDQLSSSLSEAMAWYYLSLCGWAVTLAAGLMAGVVLVLSWG